MCGKEFYTYKDRKDIKNFCSAECKKKHLDATTTKTCKFCGKESYQEKNIEDYRELLTFKNIS